MHMATVVTIEPGYPAYNTEPVEICSHCHRPLCPYCLNHAQEVSETFGIWKCSNQDCELEFLHQVTEDK
jgi:hypothetical protein